MSASNTPISPYYQDDFVTLHFGDAREIVSQELLHAAKFCVVTDPPYPNNGGHFDDDVEAAREVLGGIDCEAIVFWSELEHPPVPLPLVAVHVWHRANVNGRPSEFAYHFAPGGVKRRSEVYRHAVEFENATGAEYLGHPTQKPVALMRQLLGKCSPAIVLDPFCGVGSTLRAAKDLGRKSVGVEKDASYCYEAARRCAQEVLAVA